MNWSWRYQIVLQHFLQKKIDENLLRIHLSVKLILSSFSNFNLIGNFISYFVKDSLYWPWPLDFVYCACYPQGLLTSISAVLFLVVVVSLHWSFYYACLYVSCTLKIYVFYRIPLPHRWLHYFRLINFQLRVEQYETGTIVG